MPRRARCVIGLWSGAQVKDTRPPLRRHVTCSTRPVSGPQGLYKNSYHVVYPSVAFASNCTGEMKEFVAAVCAEWSSPRRREALSWKVVDAPPDDTEVLGAPCALATVLDTRSVLTSAERDAAVAGVTGALCVRTLAGRVCVPRDSSDDGLIDGKVYTKNCMMRTLHSCKRGSSVCFRRVHALCSPDVQATESEWCGAFITEVDAAAPWWLDGSAVRRALRTHIGARNAACTENAPKKRSLPARTLQPPAPKRPRVLHPPVPTSILAEELEPPSAFARSFVGARTVLEYDKVDTLPFAVHEWLSAGNVTGISTFYLRAPQQCIRGYLLGQRKVHHSNNAMGVIVARKSGCPCVFLQCMDAECRAQRRHDATPSRLHAELPHRGKNLARTLERYRMDPTVDAATLARAGALLRNSAAQRQQLLHPACMRENVLAWRLFLGDSWMLVPHTAFEAAF